MNRDHVDEKSFGCWFGKILTALKVVKLKEKRSIAAVEWTQKRLGTFLCTKWLKQEVKLFSKSGDRVPPLMTETTAFGLQFVFGKKAGCFCYIGA